MATQNRTIPAGAQCLSPKRACKKFSRGNTWLWEQVKADPEFPKPIYLGNRSPVFIEQELDAYLAGKLAGGAP